MTHLEIDEAMERLSQGFMTPETCWLNRSEAREYLDDPEAISGWYGRLSASGYLDCTDWVGPFDDEYAACEALADMYDDEVRS